MAADLATIMVFIKVIAEATTVTQQLISIAKRINAGEDVTLAEIAEAATEVDVAVASWQDEKERRDGEDNS